MPRTVSDTRAIAALASEQVVFRGRQLERTLNRFVTEISVQDRRFIADLVYGTVRWFWRLDAYTNLLLDRPLRRKDRDVHCLLLVGLYQLEFTSVQEYAAVSASVDATGALGKPWARGLVNAVLRKFLADRDRYVSSVIADSSRYSHPEWMIELLRDEWPHQWREILKANNARPHVTLRVNRNCVQASEYVKRLGDCGIDSLLDPVSEYGVRLTERVAPTQLPGFDYGEVSIQNSASQLVAPALDVRPGHRVLDACAAPGGKTLHILEVQPLLGELVALDIDEVRCGEINNNLQRAGTAATVLCADASQPQQWWDARPFDRILIDSPCSALGVIGKHPDIKHNRRPEDIDSLVQTQSAILNALLPLLGDNGRLMYTTCSILARENQDQIALALTRFKDCEAENLPDYFGRTAGMGRQRLPGIDSSDGFFYACLRRKEFR